MSLLLDSLEKRYRDTVALAGVTLELAAGETVALLGPSGSGKSTLLRLAAGLEPPDSGRVLLDGRDLTATPPQERGFGVVFQDYALFPHLNVADNVAFGLVERRRAPETRRARVAELLDLTGLSGLGARRVQQLSGGQQQRVALARALAPEPSVLLLDEPLSNLDAQLREALKEELAELLGRVGVRALYVTHDQAEAFTVADRVAVLRAGRFVQVAPPEELLARPRTAWLARFLGYRNVYEADDLKAVPGAPDAPALLRDDLLTLLPAGGGGPAGTDAEVRRVAHEGQQLRVELFVSAWGLPVTWRGYRRELPPDLRPGAVLGLRLPADAWVPLAPEADPPSGPAGAPGRGRNRRGGAPAGAPGGGAAGR